MLSIWVILFLTTQEPANVLPIGFSTEQACDNMAQKFSSIPGRKPGIIVCRKVTVLSQLSDSQE